MNVTVYCCGCGHDVSPRLTTGKEIYPHRPDLFDLPFWKCKTCGGHVGCHHKTKERTKPLGSIPTRELRELRKQIHAVIDPLWKSGSIPRGKLYAMISAEIGKQFHSAEINSNEEAAQVLRFATKLRNGEE